MSEGVIGWGTDEWVKPEVPCGACATPRPMWWSKGGPAVTRGWYAMACESCQARSREVEEAAERAQDAQRRQTRRLDDSGIEPRYRDRTLATFHAETPAQQAVVAKVRAFAEGFETTPGRCVVLYGPPGTGKTHLACGMLRWLMDDRHLAGRYVKIPTLLRTIRDSYGPGDGDDQTAIVTPLLTVPVLVLDEVGVQGGTDWERRTLFDFLDTRYGHRLSTIFVTNLTFEEFGAVMGSRLVDRLHEDGGLALKCDGPSWRRRTP